MTKTKKSKNYRLRNILDMEQIKLLDDRSVLVGGSAITVILGPETVSHKRYPHSPDVDVIMTDREAVKLSESLRHELIEDNMVDSHTIKLCGGMSIKRNEKNYRSPYTLLHINGYEMDIFTPYTGLGPISIDDRVFDSAIKCNVEGVELKRASHDYIMATTLNPLVATDARIKRSFLVLSQYVREHDASELFSNVLKPAVAHMKEGSKNLKKTIAEIASGKYQRGNFRRAYFNHIFKQRKKIYLGYDTYLVKTLPVRLESEKSKIAGFVTSLGIGTKNENTMIVADVAKFLRKA